MTRERLAWTLGKVGAVLALVAVVFLMPTLLGGNRYWLIVLGSLAINVLLVSSLRTVTLIREVSFGQVGFALIGAYTQAILTMKVGLNFWAALLLSGLLPALMALVLGHPFLKVKGIYFSILTLLTAEAFRTAAQYWDSLTGGILGIVGVPLPKPIRLFDHTIAFEALDMRYYLVVFVVLIALLILYHFERAYVSFQWRMIRDDGMLSRAVGVNVVGSKMANFTISAFMAGISGGLFAMFHGIVSADPISRFGILMSVYILAYLVVGGLRSFLGPLVGATLFTLVGEFARPIALYQPMITGAIAILIVIFLPVGLAGVPGLITRRVRERRTRVANAVAPTPTTAPPEEEADEAFSTALAPMAADPLPPQTGGGQQ